MNAVKIDATAEKSLGKDHARVFVMNVGTELRLARDRAGLSAAHISDRTKIQLYKIEALENNEFDRLPQGIYLDGIVRAYAHEVGIDPEPMVEGVRLQRGKLPGDWEVPFAAPIDLRGTSTAHDLNVLETPDGDDPLDAFAAENDDDLPLRIERDTTEAPIARHGQQFSREPEVPTVAHRNQISPVAPAAPIASIAPIAPIAPIVSVAPVAPVAPIAVAPTAPVARAVAPTAPVTRTAPIAPYAPVSNHRARDRARIALPVLALLAGVGVGAYLFESTRPESDPAASTVASEPRSENPGNPIRANAAATPRADRAKDLPVPYSENAITPEPESRDTAYANSVAVPRNTRAGADARTPSAQTVPQAPARTSAPPTAPAQAPARAAAPPRPQTAETNAALADLTGSWTLATQVESSSYAGYAGLRLGYEMTLEQDGERVTGVGRKITENGTGISPRGQTPVTISGTIAGDRLTLNFVERGARRPTQGKFLLVVDDGGTMKGRFTSTAARSSGRVEAYRVSAR